jgi:hypothetical protein
VDESDFWTRLEFRICSELRSSDEGHLRYYWCDGLLPGRRARQGGKLHITGHAWIGQHKQSGQELWTFTLLASSDADPEDVDWRELLPAEHLTGWLTLEPGDKALTIDLAAPPPDQRVPPCRIERHGGTHHL